MNLYKKRLQKRHVNGLATPTIAATRSATEFEIMQQEHIEQLEAQLANVKQLLEKAYLTGFNATGEGYNGEYPYGDRNLNPEEDTEWLERRDEKLKELLEETNG